MRWFGLASRGRHWLVAVLAFVLVFQGGVVGVAGLQLAAASSWDVVAAASICAAHQGGTSDRPAPVAPSHKHQHCALCAGFGLSILPAGVPAIGGTELSSLVAALPFATGPPGRSRRHVPYLSRAPPAIG